METPRAGETHQGQPRLPHHLHPDDPGHHNIAHDATTGRDSHRVCNDPLGNSCLLHFHQVEIKAGASAETPGVTQQQNTTITHRGSSYETGIVGMSQTMMVNEVRNDYMFAMIDSLLVHI